MTEKALLIDVSKCTGCRACQVACKEWNGLPAVETTCTGTYENPPDLSPDTWNKIKFKEIGSTSDGTMRWLFKSERCLHCTDAACVAVCPTGAVYHHELGFVAYDRTKCTGCGYCTQYCTFNIPRLSGNKLTGMQKMDKCTFCLDRVANGLEPACAKACPTGAISFGDRGDLILKGSSRVNELKSNGCPDAYLYGEHEMGGLHTMYVLDEKPEVYDLPANPQYVPGYEVVRQDILKPLGWALIAAAAGGFALNFLVSRSRMVKAGKKEEE